MPLSSSSLCIEYGIKVAEAHLGICCSKKERNSISVKSAGDADYIMACSW